MKMLNIFMTTPNPDDDSASDSDPNDEDATAPEDFGS